MTQFYYKMRKKRPDHQTMGMLKEKRLGRPVYSFQLASNQRLEHLMWNSVYSQLQEDLW